MIRKLSLLISIFMMALGTSAAETDFLMVSDFSASSGSQVVMPIIMTNSVAANTIAFQCELVLPAGVSVATDEYGDAMIDISTARTTAKRHSVSSSLQADGSMGIVVTSQSNSAFSGTSGEVLTVTLNIDSNVASGTYSVSIRNQELTATDLTKKKVSVKSASLVINGSGSTPEEPSEGGEEGNVPAVASDNYLTIDNLCVTPGTTKISLPIKLVNKVASNIIAFQTELVLPQGISVAEDEFGDAMIDISTERTTAKRHSVSSSIQTDGSIGIVVTSQSNSPFSGSEGEVLNVELNIPSDMAVGKYVISLRNQELTAVNLTKTKVESVNAFISVKEPEYSDTDISSFEDVVFIEGKNVSAGDELEVPIMLTNAQTTYGFELDMILPSGIEMVPDADGYPEIILGEERTTASRTTCVADYNSDGSIHISCTPNRSSYAIFDNEGAVATCKFKFSNTILPGNYQVILKNITLNNASKTKIDEIRVTFTVAGSEGDSWECSHIHGDVNGDGEVTIEDVNEVIDILLKKKK